jgi:hypothetical protein
MSKKREERAKITEKFVFKRVKYMYVRGTKKAKKHLIVDTGAPREGEHHFLGGGGVWVGKIWFPPV